MKRVKMNQVHSEVDQVVHLITCFVKCAKCANLKMHYKATTIISL